LRALCRSRRIPPRAWSTIALVLAALWVAPTVAHPTPASVPYRWELLFEPGELRLHLDPLEQEWYWFFTYQVTNRTGKVQVWAPQLTLFTDAGEIIPSGREVPVRVVTELRGLLKNELLEDQNEIIGELHHGRENAKEGLVVWPARRTDVNRLNLFIAGISGETARVRNPITGEPVVLRKTLQRDYLIRGDALARGSEPVEPMIEQWIMR
jgi:hypothetical protein